MRYLPIAGTWGRERARNRSPLDPLDWFLRGSAVDRVMVELGHQRVDQDLNPDTPDTGFWSGDVGSTLTQRIWPWCDHLKPWRDGAVQFVDFCLKRQHEFRNGLVVITHSHGGHVLVMAMDSMVGPFPFPVYVVDIDMPVQRKFRVSPMLYHRAVARVNAWTHVFSGRGWRSKFRWLGNGFNTRRLDYGARNVGPVTGGHSGILNGGGGDHIEQLPGILRSAIQ